MGRDTDKEKAQLDRLNDSIEERRTINASAAKDISATVARYNAREDKKAAADAETEEKLRKVTVSKEHIDTLMQEFGIKKDIADRLLRVHDNSLDAVYRYLIYGEAGIKTPAEAIPKENNN